MNAESRIAAPGSDAWCFKDGKLVEGNNQFAIGDAKAYAARMARGTNN
jgi:hypothetical protein